MMATGLLAPRLSIEAIRDYFSMLIPDSMFEGVEAVPPGCLLIADLVGRTHEIRRYWDCDLPPENDEGDEKDFDCCLAMLRDKFDEAVRLRLRGRRARGRLPQCRDRFGDRRCHSRQIPP